MRSRRRQLKELKRWLTLRRRIQYWYDRAKRNTKALQEIRAMLDKEKASRK